MIESHQITYLLWQMPTSAHLDMVLGSTDVADVLRFCKILVKYIIHLLGVVFDDIPLFKVQHKSSGSDLGESGSLAVIYRSKRIEARVGLVIDW